MKEGKKKPQQQDKQRASKKAQSNQTKKRLTLCELLKLSTNFAFNATNNDRFLSEIQQRNEFLNQIHKTPQSLSKYINSRPDAPALGKRIEDIVRINRRKLAKIEKSDPDNYKNLTQQAAHIQYHILVQKRYVDHSEVFEEEPPPRSICELAELLNSGDLNELQLRQIQEEVNRRLESLRNRWCDLVGKDIISVKELIVPPLDDILSIKAPVPLRPAWTEGLAKREQHALSRDLTFPNRLSLVNNSDQSEDQSTPPSIEAPSVTEKKADREIPERDNEQDSEDIDCSCDAQEIIQKAGGRTLRQPVENEPRYTFPGPLDIREEIFYDYSVIIPVKECMFDFNEEPSFYGREILAVKIAAEQAKRIIDDPIISATLGNCLSEVKPILDLAINSNGVTEIEVRDIRRKLRQAAAQIRAIRRYSVETPDLSHPEANLALESLKRQLLNMPPTKIKNKQVASDTTELYADILEIFDGIWLAPPDVVPTGPGGGTLAWGWNDQTFENLNALYLKAIGETLAPALASLKSKANNVLSTVGTFFDTDKTSGNLLLDPEQERFYARKIYGLRSSLARTLDEIAQILPLAKNEQKEGNKRLALQMIYRQYWIPEGYVRGKMVGYKNLPPDTEETVRRRTFVKTMREVTTLEDFAMTRQRDSSRSIKETSELTQEMTEKSNISASTSGNFNFKVNENFGGSFGAEAGTKLDFSKVSRDSQSLIAETTMKASHTFNEKRELKLTETIQREEEFESTHRIRNLNKEITANYFYYQLLRQYLVTVELHDLRPVLLRSKEIPTEAEIDDKFLGDYAHILAHALPKQLSADMLETVNEIESLGRVFTQALTIADDREAAYEAFRSTERPENSAENPSAGDDWDAELSSNEQRMNEARQEAIVAEERYLKARNRLDRVITHVRQNRTHYMQYIWADSPTADENKFLENEMYGPFTLPQVTRGLIREGYHGQEEVFGYNGPSIALADILVHNMIAGSEVIASFTDDNENLQMDKLRETALFQQLSRYYSDEEIDNIIEQIRQNGFVKDPAPQSGVLSSRRIQVAQDALVVETMPGQVPLLEAYQMAQRALAVERECLHNAHLRGRIKDKTWSTGTDSLRTYRREGAALPVQESEPEETK